MQYTNQNPEPKVQYQKSKIFFIKPESKLHGDRKQFRIDIAHKIKGSGWCGRLEAEHSQENMQTGWRVYANISFTYMAKSE